MTRKRFSLACLFIFIIMLAVIFTMPMSAEEYLTGDMNGDGTVNSDDAIYLLRYTLNPEKYPLVCNHNLTQYEGKAPTCTEIGWGAYETCSRCSYTTYNEVGALGHDEITVEAKEATCTDIGWDAYTECSRCDYTDDYTEIPALGHNETAHEAKEATCTDIGWDTYVTCERCDYTTYVEIPATGHSYANGTNGECINNCGYTKYSEGLVFVSNGDGTCFVSGIGSCTDTDIVLPTISPRGDKVITIGNSAFYSCDSITSVIIPDSVTSIGGSAFKECASLMSVTIGNGVTSIGDSAFRDCDSLMSVTIPDSVTSIGSKAFYGCTNLRSVTIGDSVTSIGSDAFYSCYKLVEIINKSSLNITKGSSNNGYVAYYAIEVHNGNSKIVNKDGYLFNTYNNVNYLLGYVGNEKELVLPESYNGQNYKIYQYAFYDCDNLTSVTITDSVTSIGYYAFGYCDSLTNVTIPNSVTSIGSAAFSDCTSLTSVTIPDSVTSIGSAAFEDCHSLTSVTIPDSVTSIGYYAFRYCSMLTSITFTDTSTWYRTTNSSNWQNMTGGTKTDVTNSSTNATNFKSNYYDYYWYKK